MKEIKIQVPEDFDGIDEEKSDLKNGIIIFKEKKKQLGWRYSDPKVYGYYVTMFSKIEQEPTSIAWTAANKNVFATKKQAK